MIDTPDITLPQLFENLLFNHNTCFVGEVKQYKQNPPRVDVIPVLKRQYDADEEPEIISPIEDVRLMFVSSGSHMITIKPLVGDHVVCICSQRALDDWLVDGKIQLPSSSRRFSMTDAIAIGGIFHDRSSIQTIDDGISIRSFDNKMNINMNDIIKITNDRLVMLMDDKSVSVRGQTELESGRIRVWTTIPAAGWIDLATHVHTAFNTPPTPTVEPWE